MSSPFVSFEEKREEYRLKMKKATNPKEAAEFKRLFRQTRNQIEAAKKNGNNNLGNRSVSGNKEKQEAK